VVKGMRSGEFIADDAALTTRAVVGMCEAAVGWFSRRGPWSPEEVGSKVAQLALRALLRDRGDLTAILRDAATE